MLTDLLVKNASSDRLYVEDVFSTWLYTGNGTSQTISNGIVLADTAAWSTIKLRDSTSVAATGRSVSADSSGNVYVGGTAWDTGNYIVLAKYNPFGSLQWQRKISQNTASNGRVSVDSSGNVYVVGAANQSTATCAAILKYDSSGSLQWQRKLSHATTSTFTPNGMAVDSSSNVYVIGTYGTSTYSVVAKYNSSGVIQWQRRYNVGAVTQEGYGVAVDSSLNVYTVGNNAGFSINKYDSSGAIQWQRFLDASGSGRSVAVDSSNNIYVCGVGDTNKILLARYNSSGVIQWQRRLVDSASANNVGNFITTDSAGSVYLCGTLWDGSSTYMVVAKYNSSGAIQWKRKIQQGSTVGNGITVDTSGNLYATGMANDGVGYFFTVKLSSDGTTTSGSAFVIMSESPATSATSTVSEGANSGTDAAGPAVDAAGTATDSAGTATSSTATQAAVTGAGGLVWMKGRSGATDHALYDTARGATFDLVSNSTAAQTTQSTGLTSFLASGFNIGSLAKINTSSATYVSWTWRETPKFFDVVTYTGNGSTNRQISHNLGSVPGMIIVKCTSTGATNWAVYHRGLNNGVNPQNFAIYLNLTNAQGGGRWASTAPTSTQFTVNDDNSVNTNGDTYVAYLFAHDAGGFGLDGTQNVISCGSFTGNTTVTLGWEPQFVITKSTSTTGDWYLLDTMRGWVDNGATGSDAVLNPNLSAAESGPFSRGITTATGFTTNGYPGATGIYMAIRRGPMKVPTDATTVFSPAIYTGDYNTTTPVTNMLPATDVWWNAARTIASSYFVMDRLRGWPWFNTPSTAAETNSPTWSQPTQTTLLPSTVWWGSSPSNVNYFFKRAPGFMDEVCYTGTGVARTVSHNLGVAPELMIVKGRSGATAWQVYSSGLANTEYLVLNTTAAKATGATRWNSTAPTSSVFSLGTATEVNTSAATYVAYLFATVAGVSKVGSYTGTGTTLQINCGFTNGARFVLIKRTDSTGDWYVWDSARGIIAGNDPYLLLNSIAAEVTNTDYVDAYSAGFELSSTAPAALNANGGTYIYLAIA